MLCSSGVTYLLLMTHDAALTDESGEESKRERTVGTAEDMISDGMNNPKERFQVPSCMFGAE
jgi:hypothetical protein